MRLLLLLLSAISFQVFADCQCSCINGQVAPICSNAMELKPICAPMICPIAPPSIAPLTPPSIPPLGTSRCRNQQVLNNKTNQYEWKLICQ